MFKTLEKTGCFIFSKSLVYFVPCFFAVLSYIGHGDVAQLVEHYNGIVGVRGSTPLISTRTYFLK